MKVISVCISTQRKARAFEVSQCEVTKRGMIGDIHYGMDGKHPISILPLEKAISGFQKIGEQLSFGRFGENLQLEGLNIEVLKPGMCLYGKETVLEIAEIGVSEVKVNSYSGFKVCYPMEPYFVFCNVIKEGIIRKGEELILAEKEN